MVIREWLKQSPLIAILRGIPTDEVDGVLSALLSVGCSIAEIPMNSPDPLESIRRAASVFGDRMLIGAGTVTNAQDVQRVFEAGGRLIVSPDACASVVEETKRLGMLSLPGVMTPSDAFAMLRTGADAIKIFPADVLGARMVSALRAVLPQETLLVAVGGIDVKSIGEWISAGVNGYGVGSGLYKPGVSSEMVKQNARCLLSKLRPLRARSF